MGELVDTLDDQPYDILEDQEILDEIVKYNLEDQDDEWDCSTC